MCGNKKKVFKFYVICVIWNHWFRDIQRSFIAVSKLFFFFFKRQYATIRCHSTKLHQFIRHFKSFFDRFFDRSISFCKLRWSDSIFQLFQHDFTTRVCQIRCYFKHKIWWIVTLSIDHKYFLKVSWECWSAAFFHTYRSFN